MKGIVMGLLEKIGSAAMLEQTAEEASELSQACLKLARKIRRNNPTPKTFDELEDNLFEEIADMKICLEELSESVYYDEEKVNVWIAKKKEKINDRFAE